MSILKRLPDTLVIIMVIAVLFAGLTWVIPAGTFDRVEKDMKTLVVPGSYSTTEANPQGIGDLLMSPVKGCTAAALIISFVLLVGGSFNMLTATGAINAGLYRLIGFTREKPSLKLLMVPILTVLFSLGGATFGMSEEILVFILITIPLSKALGYDEVVGTAIPVFGTGVGFAGAITNPFTIGIAQGIAELPLFSGIGYRLVVWAVLTSVAAAGITIYAFRVGRDKAHSVMHGYLARKSHEAMAQEELTGRRKGVLLVFATGMALLVIGVLRFGWYINEISALFLAIGIVSVLVFGMRSTEAVKAFYEGAKDMVPAALVIGMARGLLVLAEDGRIIDTMLNSIAGLAAGTHAALSGELMFLFQCGLNFFIPSGSGQAALTMPILSPLSDLLGIQRQTAVLAFQLGDGLSNIIIPTSGVTMGALAIAGIPYQVWLKWAIPLFVVLFLSAMLVLLPPLLGWVWAV